MANWLNQTPVPAGPAGTVFPSGERPDGKASFCQALGGLAGLLVASKSSRKLLAKHVAPAHCWLWRQGGGAEACQEQYQHENAEKIPLHLSLRREQTTGTSTFRQPPA